MRRTLIVLATGLLLVVAGCGSSEIGESCDTAGSIDDCVNGAICTNESAATVCRKVCTVQGDCGASEDCNGVSGSSTKSCQPKKTK